MPNAILAANLAELAAGLAEAAQELGTLFTLYRSANQLTAPLVPDNSVGTLLAAFPRDYTYKTAIDPLQPRRVVMCDIRLIQSADYLSDGTHTYFIGDMTPVAPVGAVLCNRYLTVHSQSSVGAATRVGDVGQLGNVAVGANANEALLLNEWPASLLYSGRGAKPVFDLPANVNAPQYTALLPNLAKLPLATDVVTDDLNNKYQIVAVEQNSYGVRLIVDRLE